MQSKKQAQHPQKKDEPQIDDKATLDRFVVSKQLNQNTIKKPIVESHDQLMMKVKQIQSHVQQNFDVKTQKSKKEVKHNLKGKAQPIDLDLSESYPSEAVEPQKTKKIKKDKQVPIAIKNSEQCIKRPSNNSNTRISEQTVSDFEDDLQEEQVYIEMHDRKKGEKIAIENSSQVKTNSKTSSSNEPQASQEAQDKSNLASQEGKINKSKTQEQIEFAQDCQLLEQQLQYWMIKQKGDFNMAKTVQNDADDFDIEILGFKTLGKERIPYVLFLPYLLSKEKLGVDLQQHFQSVITSKENRHKPEALQKVLLLPTVEQYELIVKCVQKCIPKKDSKSKQKNQKRNQRFKQLRDELNTYKQKQDMKNDQ